MRNFVKQNDSFDMINTFHTLITAHTFHAVESFNRINLTN